MMSTIESHSGRSAYSRLRSGLLLRSIPALDGIRAIAVFLVILYHLSIQRALPVFPGPLGVLIFFVLSGFLITWLLIKEEEKYGSISLKGFYRRRALRIFPAFYVFWIVAVASRLVAHGQDVPWSQAISAFFYVSNYFHAIFHPTPDYMIHTWSLSAEEQFYLLWPLSFVMLSKKKRLLMLGLGAVIAAIWVHRVHLWIAAHASDYITYAFDTRADALLAGCLLALALKEGLGKGLLEKVCRLVWAPAITIFLIGVSVFLGQWSEGYKLTGGLAIEPLLVAILMCQLVVHSASGPWKWLNAKSMVYLGKISYPLYLYHMLAAHLATRLDARIPGSNTPLFLTAGILLAVLIASCSYQFVEKPFLALKDKSSSPSTAARVPLRSPRVGDGARPSATPAS